MQASSIQTMRSHLADALRPIRAMRWAYLPLLMVYFAYGALGLIDVSRDMWIKERLTLSAAELAGLGVWLSLPWTMKMVFGQLVDCFPILGSQRRAYVLIGATPGGGRSGRAGRRRRRLDCVRAPGPALYRRRDADGAWRGDPGRRRRRHVDRGRSARRRGRAIRAPKATSAPTSAWSRCSAASRWPSASCRSRGFPGGSRSTSTGRRSSLSASWCRRSRCSGCSSCRKA